MILNFSNYLEEWSGGVVWCGAPGLEVTTQHNTYFISTKMDELWKKYQVSVLFMLELCNLKYHFQGTFFRISLGQEY